MDQEKNQKNNIKDSLIELQKAFSPTEKVIFWIFAILLFISSFLLVKKVSELFMVDVPKYGGQLTEGIIGFPRFINPLFTVTDADRDMTSLIYSGLMRYVPEEGLVGDLAEGYSLSQDKTTYTFTIREKAVFHDGRPVTSDDVIFTIEKAQNPSLKSMRLPMWANVKVEKIDSKTVKFILQKNNAYAAFPEITTMGILPKHIWKDVTEDEFTFSQYNIEPIGSGPYKISNITRTSGGIPEYYDLKAFSDFTLGKPFIENLRVKFYSSQEKALSDLKNSGIESFNIVSVEDALDYPNKKTNLEKTSLPRIFGIFFNQDEKPLFAYKEVREALNTSVDRDLIVKEILKGYGIPVFSPIPKYTDEIKSEASIKEETDKIASAIKILEKAGWKKNINGIFEKKINKNKTETLSFSISTSNTSDLKTAVSILKETWNKIGADVSIKIFDPSDLSQTVIRPRKYDSLFFGIVMNRTRDLYPYWHSKQRLDPGYNISMYANAKVDNYVEEVRAESDPEKQKDLFGKFESEIAKDIPAIFIYSPDFLYAVPNDLRGISLRGIDISSERFSGIYKWYRETEKIWFFLKSIY